MNGFNTKPKHFSISDERVRFAVRQLQGIKIFTGDLKEIVVDSHSTEWYLPIPLAGRDYKVELGYRIGHKWMSLAHSSSAKVPSLHPSEQILDQFVPFSLDAAPAPAPTATAPTPQAPAPANETSDGDLHERLYQSATVHFRRRRVGSEEFQEAFHDSSASSRSGLNDSGIGLWASGRNESGLGGVASRQRSFWLVADAELIVYGATDPSARLTIGGEEVPLSACLLYTSPSPRDLSTSRMPSSA